ncbi:MAG: M20/M25/M40 family metallo-hydrolase, partial [Armatimonadetes bacterium]|nr:M20/M25/M40 family metallo-hydrolase [Armatimonadota bacterium]
MKRFVTAVWAVLLASGLTAWGQGDPDVVARIIDEGKNRNRVMEHLRYLTQVIGPRLTGSPNLQRACEWTAAKFKEFGLQNVQLEQWGEVPVGFARGPRQVARMVSPEVREFEFTTRAWSAGTTGLTRGRAVLAPKTMETLELLGPILKDAWILTGPRRRLSEEEREVQAKIDEALEEAGIAGRVVPSRNDLVRTGGSWRGLSYDNLPTGVTVYIRRSDSEAIIDQVAKGEDVILEFDIENHFLPGPVPVYNVIAEIPGTEMPDEVVIVSGHLDSWDGPGSQGTCDNGTGTMVALEAARILMASGAKPKRTIRFIMWTGEEQGLHGSREYVKMHADELDKISAVLVDDGGTNYSGGLQCIQSMV